MQPEILSTKFNFNHLSIKDLVEARDMFHLHLLNKKNVVATAIGRYRIRKTDPWPNQMTEKSFQRNQVNPKKKERTLENSEVRSYSWPCIYVFVDEWESFTVLSKEGRNDLVPKCIYMPDGRVVPLCVVKASKMSVQPLSLFQSNIVFPSNYVGGGFPLLVNSQGEERIASIGCLVTDGNKYYAVTNKHVVGGPGTPIYAKMKGKTELIGYSSDKQVSKSQFQEMYPEWASKHIYINNDVGLIDIINIRQWKTEVFGIGEIDELANLSTSNISLDLITAVDPVSKRSSPMLNAFGALSGKVRGEIAGLFYRYKSLGGAEYVSDFIIGGTNGEPLNIHHGDSGTLWLLEDTSDKTKNYPFAIHWGQHNLISGDGEQAFPYALATNLTNICVKLDVDVVRGWNIDNDYTWGKTGHFKVAAKACELVSSKNSKLSKLLMANQANIGYVDSDLLNGDVVSGSYSDSKNVFVPLADVADIIWRSTRPSDESNHFADVDEKNKKVFNGKSLLKLCTTDDTKIDIDFWIQFYAVMDTQNPNFKVNKNGKKTFRPRDGALPFRVWQMYLQMIKSLKAKNIPEFICAGGTMSHYLGDACQSLHVSYLHHGHDDSESDVHTDYETTMIDKSMDALFKGVNKARRISTNDLLPTKDGKNAAIRIIQLMETTQKNLSPETIIRSWNNNKGVSGKYKNMWNDLGQQTVRNIINGCKAMAILWESAWKYGNGNQIAAADLVEVDPKELRKLYNRKTFAPSYKISDPKFKAALR